jgi:hypothetical protein
MDGPRRSSSQPAAGLQLIALFLVAVAAGIFIGWPTRWTFIRTELGWSLFVLFTYPVFPLFWNSLGFAPLHGLGYVTASGNPIWKQPGIWSWALFLATTRFVRVVSPNVNAIQYAAKEAGIVFLAGYPVISFLYWVQSPAKWEREA